MENQPKRSPRKMGKAIGQSGTAIFKGHIRSEEYNSKLTGRGGIKIYEIMRRSDATVHSTLQVVKLPVLSTDWSIEPASDDDNDVKQANFIEDQLFNKNLNWPQFLREALTMLDFGHSVAEKTLELTVYDGQTHIGIKSIGFRKQSTILNWEADGEPGITQQLPTGGNATIPRAKLMYFVNDLEGENYEGISLLRYAYKPWDIKDKLDIINAIALEKMGVGVPVIEQPADAPQSEIDAADVAMREFRANEEAYQKIPSGWKMEMLDMKANTTKDILPSIQYQDRQIQISVLAQFLALGASDASGSRAVSEDHSRMFLLSEEALAKTIQSVIQRELIDQLCELNFTNMPNGCPKIKFSSMGEDKIDQVAESVNKLMGVGAISANLDTENHLRRILKMPEVDDTEYEEIAQNRKLLIDESIKKVEDKDDDKKTKKLSKEDSDEVKATKAITAAKNSEKALIDILVRK